MTGVNVADLFPAEPKRCSDASPGRVPEHSEDSEQTKWPRQREEPGEVPTAGLRAAEAVLQHSRPEVHRPQVPPRQVFHRRGHPQALRAGARGVAETRGQCLLASYSHSFVFSFSLTGNSLSPKASEMKV